jgi:uncharacterized lipoprotein
MKGEGYMNPIGKKHTCILIVLCAVLIFAACSSNDTASEPSNNDQNNAGGNDELEGVLDGEVEFDHIVGRYKDQVT